MDLSVLETSLPGQLPDKLQKIAKLGFEWVDLIGKRDRPEEDYHALADSGLKVKCVSVGRNLLDGTALDSHDVRRRKIAVDHVKAQIDDAAKMGASVCYFVPGSSTDDNAFTCFAESCELLSNFAANRKLQLCLEHFPGKALPTVQSTLSFFDNHSLSEMALLLDVGHCLISKEDPVQMIRLAGTRLGYVQMDDNDGINDLHWGLCTGVLTEENLHSILVALQSVNYQSAIGLEFDGQMNEAELALMNARRFLLGE